MIQARSLRIGGCSGFWGESPHAARQLLESGNVDVLVFDYLAEVTMSIMARARASDPKLGFARDFVTEVLKPNLPAIASQRVKVIANAGGVNPGSCAELVRELIDNAGLELKVAVVSGDDLLSRSNDFAENDVKEMFSSEHFPEPNRVASINAYLGAFPIAAALAAGADIVITGRCVDSAVTLGACVHHFGWRYADLDEQQVADNMANIGYPVAEISADGSFVVSKPQDTGGIVTVGTVSEQILYEIGDPQAYKLPDVTCDFSGTCIEQIGTNRVRVSGARGATPPDHYKVSATYADGFRGGQLLFFYGDDASQKAQAYADAVVTRSKQLLQAAGFEPFSEICIESFGDESHYGAARRVTSSREVTLKIAAKHQRKEGIAILLAETIGMGLGAPPGLALFQGGRPRPSPVVRLFSFLVPKNEVSIDVTVDDQPVEIPIPDSVPTRSFDRPSVSAIDPSEANTKARLYELAWGRSGDKGNNANIGIIARKPEYLPWIWNAITEECVAKRFSHFLEGPVERFLLPGPNAINFLLHDVLGGGGIASLRNDPQGKGYAQLLLDEEVPIPDSLLES
jgi:hypothetical protein